MDSPYVSVKKKQITTITEDPIVNRTYGVHKNLYD